MDTPIDVFTPLGQCLHEPEVRDLLAALHLKAVMTIDSGYAFLQNHRRGIELTFRPPAELKVRLRDYPDGALVLHNIRMYCEAVNAFSQFSGPLPFGLRHGDTRTSLIDKFGPPDWEDPDLGAMRWDTDRYAVFADVANGILECLAMQTPVVRTDRPGFPR